MAAIRVGGGVDEGNSDELLVETKDGAAADNEGRITWIEWREMVQSKRIVHAFCAAPEFLFLEVEEFNLHEMDLPSKAEACEGVSVSVLEQTSAKGIFTEVCK
jgi:hypothetical protein